MSAPLPSELLASICDEARVLVQQSGNHEDDLAAMVEACEMYVRRADEALSARFDATEESLDQLHALLSSHLQSFRDGAATARQICAGAHRHHLAAIRLLTRLARDLGTEGFVDQRCKTGAVLVVDDYQEIRDSVARVLRHAGFVVRTADNGLEGLLAAYEMRPAVIVMDVSMPVLDGIQATRLIKATDAISAARVIAFTGEPEFEDTAVTQLFAAFLQKPASPEFVLATVQQVASL